MFNKNIKKDDIILLDNKVYLYYSHKELYAGNKYFVTKLTYNKNNDVFLVGDEDTVFSNSLPVNLNISKKHKKQIYGDISLLAKNNGYNKVYYYYQKLIRELK